MDLGGKYAGGWTFICNKLEYTLITVLLLLPEFNEVSLAKSTQLIIIKRLEGSMQLPQSEK